MNHEIKPLVPVNPEGLDEIAEALLNETPPEEDTCLADTNVQNNQDFWRIGSVQYRNGIYVVDLAKSLLDNGNTRTQDDWAKHYESAIGRNEFHTPNYPLLYGLVKALYNARDKPAQKNNVAETSSFLKDKSRAHWLMTLTRVRYQPQGNDVVIHNYGTRDKYEEQVDFIGPDERIEGTAKPLACQRLLGTNDSVQNINNLFNWLNGTDIYIWRVNKKPKKVDERVAGFGAGSVGAILNCNRNPSCAYSSLGVRFVRAQKNF